MKMLTPLAGVPSKSRTRPFADPLDAVSAFLVSSGAASVRPPAAPGAAWDPATATGAADSWGWATAEAVALGEEAARGAPCDSREAASREAPVGPEARST